MKRRLTGLLPYVVDLVGVVGVAALALATLTVSAASPTRGTANTFRLSATYGSIAFNSLGDLYASRGGASPTDPASIDLLPWEGANETIIDSSTLLPILSKVPRTIAAGGFVGSPFVSVSADDHLYFSGRLPRDPTSPLGYLGDLDFTGLWRHSIDGSNQLITGSNSLIPFGSQGSNVLSGSYLIASFAASPDGSLWTVTDGCPSGLRRIDPNGVITTEGSEPLWASAAFVATGPSGDAFATFYNFDSVVRYAGDRRVTYLPLIDDRKAATIVASSACANVLTRSREPVFLGAPAPPKHVLAGPLAVDAAGAIFVAENNYINSMIVKVTPDGQRTQIAGLGGDFQEGGSALQAGILLTDSIVIDSEGNLLCQCYLQVKGQKETRWIKIWRVAAPGLVAGRPMAGNGDVDRDGTVALKDALLARRGVLGIADLSAEARAVADTNGDGVFNLGDVLRILKRAISAPG